MGWQLKNWNFKIDYSKYNILREIEKYITLFFHQSATPKWIEVQNSKDFVKYAEANLSDHKGEAMVIKESRKAKLREIAELCLRLNWNYCSQAEVRGSESSLVIVYDCSIFEYKSFTRAKNNLLIVTISGKRYQNRVVRK